MQNNKPAYAALTVALYKAKFHYAVQLASWIA